MSFYSNNINEFAKQVVWYDCPERHLKTPEAFNNFLVFLMGRGGSAALAHARTVFGITDEQLANALQTAKPGVFIYEENWNRWNEKLGIVPTLPFPRKQWAED